MRAALSKLTPTSGLSHLLHLVLRVLLPLTAFVLVRLGFVQLALSIIVLSKWRMFAVRPRFWPALVRANAVDLMVGVAVVLFMAHTTSLGVQFSWAVLYAGWLIYVKPATTSLMVPLQALIGQFAALMALYLWANGPLYALVIITGFICYLTARHFFDSFDEAYAKLLSYFWGYFGAALTWLLGHWLLFYSFISQPTLLLTTIGYGLATLYYLDHHGRLSAGLRRQFVFIMLAIVLIVLTFSDWGNKVV